ncbi:hypothetical protein B0H12DRAFT_1131522, partial [Mycena haematopus]
PGRRPAPVAAVAQHAPISRDMNPPQVPNPFDAVHARDAHEAANANLPANIAGSTHMVRKRGLPPAPVAPADVADKLPSGKRDELDTTQIRQD